MMGRHAHIDILITEVIQKRIEFDSHKRVIISIRFQCFHYSIKRFLKLLRESEMVQAVIIQIDEAVDASGFQNTRYIFHDIKAV